MTVPFAEMRRGIMVIRDDPFPGGTKARHSDRMFNHADEAVHASPAEGGAQTARVNVARALRKRATIFVARRAKPHARTLEAARLGAKVVPVLPGYPSVMQEQAKECCRTAGAFLIPFGAESRLRTC